MITPFSNTNFDIRICSCGNFPMVHCYVVVDEYQWYGPVFSQCGIEHIAQAEIRIGNMEEEELRVVMTGLHALSHQLPENHFLDQMNANPGSNHIYEVPLPDEVAGKDSESEDEPDKAQFIMCHCGQHGVLLGTGGRLISNPWSKEDAAEALENGLYWDLIEETDRSRIEEEIENSPLPDRVEEPEFAEV